MALTIAADTDRENDRCSDTPRAPHLHRMDRGSSPQQEGTVQEVEPAPRHGQGGSHLLRAVDEANQARLHRTRPFRRGTTRHRALARSRQGELDACHRRPWPPHSSRDAARATVVYAQARQRAAPPPPNELVWRRMQWRHQDRAAALANDQPTSSCLTPEGRPLRDGVRQRQRLRLRIERADAPEPRPCQARRLQAQPAARRVGGTKVLLQQGHRQAPVTPARNE